ncbi:MAG: hypothetical protein GX267_06065 [Fibrobacter sp.]|jgi:hypothetical protein|nr:hypothetical protein [Fibrobacter sp.]
MWFFCFYSGTEKNGGKFLLADVLALIVIGSMAIVGESTFVGDILLMIALVLLWGFLFNSLE